jgi:hypothetical protein
VLKSSFTALMLSQCQAHVISHRAELVLLTRVPSRLFIFKTLRMLCLKQNTKGGLPFNRNLCSNRHHFDHQLGRLAALESAFRPNLSLGTQVASSVTLRVLNYIISIISWAVSSARERLPSQSVSWHAGLPTLKCQDSSYWHPPSCATAIWSPIPVPQWAAALNLQAAYGSESESAATCTAGGPFEL